MTNFASVDPMTWVAAGYGLVLLAAAYGIDYMARRASHSLDARQNPGFVYHEDHDAWLCPEDQWLWPQSYDPDNRVMRYRGSPSICNSCPVKDTCTTSMSGREVTRTVDPWPASEAAKFHRGIACTVTVLAIIWPLAMLASGPGVTGAVILGAVTAVILAGSMPLWRFLWRTDVDPTGVLERTADDNIAARRAAAAAYSARSTSYRSDRLSNAARGRDILGDELAPVGIGGASGGSGSIDDDPLGGTSSRTAAARAGSRALTGTTAAERTAAVRSSWRDVAARIDNGHTTTAAEHHRYRSDRIRAEQDAIARAEEEVKNTA